MSSCHGSSVVYVHLCCTLFLYSFIFFFFNDTATTEIYTLSLHDALPISSRQRRNSRIPAEDFHSRRTGICPKAPRDRKSTSLNSSHSSISYAVFCLKKKKKKKKKQLPL